MLAERLSRRFGREVGYSVLPYDRRLHAEVFAARSRAAPAARLRRHRGRPPGDGRDAGRRPAARGCAGTDVWWLDAGNGRNSGQVLLGNATRAEHLRGAFDRERGTCRALPAPSLQRPDLLAAPPPPAPAPGLRRGRRRRRPGRPRSTRSRRRRRGLRGAAARRDLRLRWAPTWTWTTARCAASPPTPRTVAALTGLHPNAVAPPSTSAGARAGPRTAMPAVAEGSDRAGRHRRWRRPARRPAATPAAEQEVEHA